MDRSMLPELRELAAEWDGVPLTEASSGIERELAAEDLGWVRLGHTGGDTISDASRISTVKRARTYYVADPLAKQGIRLWTDYTFGRGLTFSSEDGSVQKALEKIWKDPANRSVFSAQGQRKSSDKGLVEGEVFFALFIGEGTKVRRIDPLEITEILSDPDDIEDVKLYKREWTDAQGHPHTEYYRSTTNPNGEPWKDKEGTERTPTVDALVYHLALNTIEQRGNSILTPALDWIKEYRRFLASRMAVVLALARFAWKSKIKGGAASVEGAKAQHDETTPEAGSWLFENMGMDTQPIKADTGASDAYQDGRMIKLQICAAVGIPEQYFGDISTGNLATAKTVELPLLKQFQSYQQIWADAYRDMFAVILDTDVFIDIDFPEIAPRDAASAIKAIMDLVATFPQFGASEEVQTVALTNIGLNNIPEVLEKLGGMPVGERMSYLAKVAALVQALRDSKVIEEKR